LPDVQGIESAAVIDDLETESAVAIGKTGHDPTCHRVVLDVVKRFLRDSEDDQLLLGVQPQTIALFFKRRANPAAVGQVRDQPFQRWHQPQIVQNRRA